MNLKAHENNITYNKVIKLQNGINDTHYAFTKKIADQVLKNMDAITLLTKKINELEIKEIDKNKSYGGTTDE
tara:strand:- start:792 stop:1007 length:216 start_codon:yes stop_codon:yes gene_type:complete